MAQHQSRPHTDPPQHKRRVVARTSHHLGQPAGTRGICGASGWRSVWKATRFGWNLYLRSKAESGVSHQFSGWHCSTDADLQLRKSRFRLMLSWMPTPRSFQLRWSTLFEGMDGCGLITTDLDQVAAGTKPGFLHGGSLFYLKFQTPF